MCHLFIVGRSLARRHHHHSRCCRLYLQRIAFDTHETKTREKDREKRELNPAAHWKNKSYHRHQHRQIQAHHSFLCAKGLEEPGTMRKNYIPFPTSIFSSYVQWASQTNACMFVSNKKKKKNGWRNENLYLFAFAEWRRRRPCMGRSSNKKNVATCKQRHSTIFMYYAENLHSLRLGFKTFYKWDVVEKKKNIYIYMQPRRSSEIKQKRAKASKSYGFKIQQTNQCKPYNTFFGAMKMHSKRRFTLFLSLYPGRMISIECAKGLNFIRCIFAHLKLATADLVMNGDFSRVFMHIISALLHRQSYLICIYTWASNQAHTGAEMESKTHSHPTLCQVCRMHEQSIATPKW